MVPDGGVENRIPVIVRPGSASSRTDPCVSRYLRSTSVGNNRSVRALPSAEVPLAALPNRRFPVAGDGTPLHETTSVTPLPAHRQPPSGEAPSTPGLRIRELRLRLDLPQKVFARYLAVSQSTLSQIENGYYSPSYGSIARLAEKVPFDCNWLIRGVGEPFAEAEPIRPSTDEDVGIPGVSERALAGYSAKHRDETWALTLPRFTVPGYTREGDFRIFQALGDSMEPTILDQDFLVCERIVTPLDSFVGQPVVCVLDEEVLVKRLANYAPASASLTVSCDNPRYKTVEIAEEDVYELWHVTGRLTRNLSPALANQDYRLRQLEASYQDLSAKVEQLLGEG